MLLAIRERRWVVPSSAGECRSPLQAAKLRLLLCFLHSDRLTQRCPLALRGGRVPQTIADWFCAKVRATADACAARQPTEALSAQDLSEAEAEAVDAPLDAAAVLRHFVRVKVDVSAARAGQVHYSVGSSVWVGQPTWRELKTGDVVVRANGPAAISVGVSILSLDLPPPADALACAAGPLA